MDKKKLQWKYFYSAPKLAKYVDSHDIEIESIVYSSHVYSVFYYENNSSKQSKDIITCKTDKMLKLYCQLLSMIDKERMSNTYPKWCKFEHDFINLFGEDVFKEYFNTLE